jgi:hypothetical protein
MTINSRWGWVGEKNKRYEANPDYCFLRFQLSLAAKTGQLPNGQREKSAETLPPKIFSPRHNFGNTTPRMPLDDF